MNPELMAEVILGRDAEDFYATDIGRYILARVEEEIQEAHVELGETDPTDTKTIIKWQTQLKRAESLKGWLDELIINGRQAMAQLQSEE